MWKPIKVLGLLFAIVLVAACGDDGDEDKTQEEEDLEPTPEPDESEPTAEVMPSIGGTMLAVGSHHVEVVPAEDGNIEAVVRDAEGEPVTGGDATVEATVRVADSGETAKAGGGDDSTSTAQKKAAPSGGGERGGKGSADNGTDKDSPKGTSDGTDKGSADEASRGSKPLPQPKLGQRKGQQGQDSDKQGTGSKAGGTATDDSPSKGAGSKAGAQGSAEAGGEGEAAGGAGAGAEAEAEAETTKTVKLAWDDSLQRYHARLDEGLRVVAGEIGVSLEVGGKKEKASAPRVAVAPSSRHGGVVLLAGSVAAEVRTTADGEIRAYVEDEDAEEAEDAEEKKKAEAPLQGALVVRVQTQGGNQRAVPLHWSAEHGLYVGKLRGAKLAAGPLELVHDIDGTEHRGRVDEVAAPAAAKHGGHLVAAGDHTVELKAGKKGKLHAFLYDKSGKPVQGKGKGKATLRADVTVDGSQTPVELSWNADAKRYEAKVEGKVKLSAAPVHVTVTKDGRKRRGRLARGLNFAKKKAAVDLTAVIEAHAQARPTPGVGAQGKGKGKAKGAAAGVKARGAAGAGADVEAAGAGAAAKARKRGQGAAERAEEAAGRAEKAAGRVQKQAGGSANVRAGGGGDDDDDQGGKKKGVKVRAGGSAGVEVGGGD